VNFPDELPVFLTEKDAVKCVQLEAGNIWSVAAEIQFHEGAGEELLRIVMQSVGSSERT